MAGINNCLLCGASGAPAYSGMRDLYCGIPGEWELLRCGACDLYWIAERTEFSKIYPADYLSEINIRRGWREDLKERIRLRAAGLDAGFFRRFAGAFLGCVPPLRRAALLDVMYLDIARKGRLLDLGCGQGEFLCRMRRLGWDTTGVEPNRRTAEISAGKGLKVLCSRFEDLKLEENTFDAVTMNHVIEHLADPVDVFRTSFRLLGQGGELSVLTPNSGSLGHLLFSRFWQPLDVPRHYFIFSRRSLGLLAEKAGFKVKSMRVVSSNAAIVFRNSVAFFLKREQRRIPGIHAAAACFRIVSELAAYGGLGEEVLLSAEKV